ncbi:MAG: hypothetical protein ACLVJH_02125 [Faecalibacterium prausnitzii]
MRIRAKQSAMDIAVIRCRSQTVRGSKKRPPIGVTSFQRIFGVNPAAGEPTISMTALLELLFA